MQETAGGTKSQGQSEKVKGITPWTGWKSGGTSNPSALLGTGIQQATYMGEAWLDAFVAATTSAG